MLAAWLIAGAYGTVLKLLRVLVYPQRLSLDKKLALLVPELAYSAGMAMVCLLVAIGAARVRLAWVALVIAQLLATFSVVVHTLAHGYFSASGQPLDYAMVAFSLARASERVGVVASASNVPLASGLIGSVLAIAVAPAWIWWRSRESRGAAAELAQSPTWPSLALLLACVGCAALTGVSPSRRIERTFARDPVTTLALGMVRAQLPDTSYRGQPSRPRKTGAKSLRARSGADKRNVVVIVLESTRADATTPYAPRLKTTPFFSKFAREGVLVERAYTVVPHTTKALVAILCGFEPEVTLSTIESQPGGLPGRCLPSLLAAQGYDTAFFQAPTGRFEDRKRLAQNLGFRKFVSGDDVPHEGFERINYFGFEDAIMLAPSEEWLARRGERPFMAAYLTNAAHHPYDVPKTHEIRNYSKKRAWNKYLNAINYTDGVVEKIVDQYRRLSLLDRTVFVIVGDHGEGFGEHGLWVHDDVMFEEALRVPLVFRLPGAHDAGRRISGPVSELAIVPSLISLAGFESRDADYEQGNLFEQPKQPALYAHCYRADRCAAVLRDSFKLITHLEERPPELYDLANDPGEKDDIADDHPELVERWTRELADVRVAIHASYREASARALERFISESEPEVPREVNASFGDLVTLRGVKPPSQVAQLGTPGNDRFFVGYIWWVHRRIPPGYTIRVQLRGERGSVNLIHRPLRGLLSFEDFPPDRYIDDTQRISLPPDWSSPDLTLCLSVIDDRGRFVPVTQPGKPEATCVPVGTVKVHGR